MSHSDEPIVEEQQQPSEEQPLLQSEVVKEWSPPPGFLLIQFGESIESAEEKENIDHKQRSWPTFSWADSMEQSLPRPMQ